MHTDAVPNRLRSYPVSTLRGELQVPGDKSISHRCAILAALARGQSRISGFLAADDTLATLAAVRALGVAVSGTPKHGLVLQSPGIDNWQQPTKALDLGNSGTGIRLLAGALAASHLSVTLTGDESLRRRPMERIATPLRLMGASVGLAQVGTPPIEVDGSRPLKAIDYTLPVASAQLKSALLLAGLGAAGTLRINEPAPSRDHTERMLSACGVSLRRDAGRLSMKGGQTVQAMDFSVPGDPSSAAFFAVAAVIAGSEPVCLRTVGVNPTRIGFVKVLEDMGAQIEFLNQRELSGEPVADLMVHKGSLQGGEFGGAAVASYIDELPILFVAAACAQGRTRFSDIGELRVKESDRIAVMVDGLRRLGISVEAGEDWVVIEGGALSGGKVDAGHDHRCAMSFAVAATAATGPVEIDGCAEIGTSYPEFMTHAGNLGMRVEVA